MSGSEDKPERKKNQERSESKDKVQTIEEYVARHIPVLDVAHVLLSAERGISRSELSRMLELSKPTAWGYLVKLEKAGFISYRTSDTNRRDRKYFVVDQAKLRELIRQSFQSNFEKAKFKGRIFPVGVFTDKLYDELRRMSKGREIKINSAREIPIPPYLHIPISIESRDGHGLLSIVVYRIDSYDTTALALGRLVLLTSERRKEDLGRIAVIIIVDPSFGRVAHDRNTLEKLIKIATVNKATVVYREVAGIESLINKDDFARNMANRLLDTYLEGA